MNSKRLTAFIVVGMVLGVVLGYALHALASPAMASRFADIMELLPFAFLRLIKMVIAPLVFSTLVIGVAKMGDIATVGRIGAKTLGWFLCGSLISLVLGLVLVRLFEPGKALSLSLPAAGTVSGIVVGAMSLRGFIEHMLPSSVIDAMAHNEILPIVIFSLFFGTAMATLGERSRIVLEGLDAVSHIMLKVTGFVMIFAPFAVFGALASTVAKEGLGVIGVYGLFIGEVYLGLASLWVILIGFGLLFVGGGIFRLIRRIREPVLLAFSTASSEAAYPRTLEELERFGCSNKVTSFVLSLGYSFNLDGSMMYCIFAVMFIAQAYGIELTLAQQIMLMVVLMMMSKGMAGVPRASLVVVTAALSQFGLPEGGILLLLGVDHFLDMGRSATNVVGNSIATAIVSKSEGELTGKAAYATVTPA
jgi:Na+/H+-dicarboxylate symporter